MFTSFSPVSCLLFTKRSSWVLTQLLWFLSLLYFLLSDFCLFIMIFFYFLDLFQSLLNLIENLNQILRCFLKILCNSKYFCAPAPRSRGGSSSEPWGRGMFNFWAAESSQILWGLPCLILTEEILSAQGDCEGGILISSDFIFPCGKIRRSGSGRGRGTVSLPLILRESDEGCGSAPSQNVSWAAASSGNNWLGPEAGNVSGPAGKA